MTTGPGAIGLLWLWATVADHGRGDDPERPFRAAAETPPVNSSQPRRGRLPGLRSRPNDLDRRIRPCLRRGNGSGEVALNGRPDGLDQILGGGGCRARQFEDVPGERQATQVRADERHAELTQVVCQDIPERPEQR